MNRLECSTLFIARLVLEAETALSISTGNPDGVFDTALVRDANGLPAIPGSSLAGVLRHLWQSADPETVDELFGYQHGREGRASRLTVSWGALLDSTGTPAEGLLIGKKASRLQKDPLYTAVLDQIDSPVHRDRVRITHRGAAADTGKFDRSVLPAGHRFAVELRLWAESPEAGEGEWNRLLSLLRHPAFRLGGATRAGLGKMRLISLYESHFDLRQPQDRKRFAALGRGLGDFQELKEKSIEAPNDDGWKTATLRLKARGPWRIGQGNVSLSNREKPADLLPKTEERIVWDNGKAERQLKMLLIPASSIKGALAHRMAFHARRFTGDWNHNAETLDDQRPDAVQQLLGWVKDSKDGDEKGHVGRLILDDGALTVDGQTIIHLMHNAIDRFTGGVRNRMLFDEESLFGGELQMELTIDTTDIDDTARRALKAALDDLCQGRLAIGSKTTTGNGYFTGNLEGPLTDWLNTKTQQEAA